MGKFYDVITPDLQEFIEKQHMFFVSTAPLDPQGHINLSPKGLDTFKIINAHQVAYLDFVGSGNETSAHTLENGRITLMFCSFDKVPNILRIYGKGRTILPSDAEWEALSAHFDIIIGIRQLIIIDIEKLQSSCGFGVPRYDFVDQRDMMTAWAEKKGEQGLKDYITEKNMNSIDGLPTALKRS